MLDKPIALPLLQIFVCTLQNWTFQQRLMLNEKVLLEGVTTDVLQHPLRPQVNFGMMLNRTNLLVVMRLSLMLRVVLVLELQQVAFVTVGTSDINLCRILDKDLGKIGKSLTLSYVMS